MTSGKEAIDVKNENEKYTTIEDNGETEEEEEKEEEEDNGIPYDRGFAWLVVLGGFLNFIIMAGYLKSGGVFFVELLRKYNASSTQASVMFGLRGAIYSVTGMIVMTVVLPRLGSRKTVFIGATLITLSAILPGVKDDLTSIICFQAVFLGMGMSMMGAPSDVLIGAYFKKRRSLALALAKCGSSFGSVAIPPLVTYLIEEFGLQGAFILTGGFCMHAFVAGALLEPTSNYIKRNLRKSQKEQQHLRNNIDMDALSVTGIDSKGNYENKTLMSQIISECNEDNQLISSSNNLDKINESNESLIDFTKSLELPTPHLEENAPNRYTVRHSSFSKHSSDKRSRLDNIMPLAGTSQTSNKCSNITTKNPTKSGNSLSKSNPNINHLKLDMDGPTRARTFSEPPIQWESKEIRKDETKVNKLDLVSSSSVLKVLSQPSLDFESTFYINQSENFAQASSKFLVRRTFSRQFSEAAIANSIISMTVVEASAEEYSEEYDEKTSGTKTARTCIQNCFRHLIDVSLFRNHMFKLLLLYYALYPCVNIIVDYLPALAIEKGADQTQAALLVSVVSGLDFISRLLSGVIADLKKVRVPSMIIFTFIVLGVLVQFVRFMKSYYLLFILTVVQGFLGGVANALGGILIIEFVGLENMGKGIGFAMLTSGACSAAIYPLLGLIRDITGSYNTVYNVIGGFILVAAGLLCCEGFVKRMELRKRIVWSGKRLM